MVKRIIKLLLKYPLKLANRIYVDKFYKNSPKRDSYDIDNIIGPADKVMVFAPHVDDETIGLGATLLKAKRLGAKMSLIYMTDGGGSSTDLSRQDLIDERVKEAHVVKKTYGFQNMYFLDEPDGSLDSNKDELIHRTLELLNKGKPTVVFVPFLIDGHKDHVETTKLVIKALEKWDESFDSIYMYEINTAIYPQLITDLTHMDKGIYIRKSSVYRVFKSQGAMGFDAFRLMDIGKRFLLEDDEKTVGGEAFIRVDVATSKSILSLLESKNFIPEDFRQISSEYNLIQSFTKNKDKKEELMDKVSDLLDKKS